MPGSPWRLSLLPFTCLSFLSISRVRNGGNALVILPFTRIYKCVRAYKKIIPLCLMGGMLFMRESYFHHAMWESYMRDDVTW